MRRKALLSLVMALLLLLIISQCNAANEDKAKYYGKVEMLMIDFSKKIKAHYMSQGMKIPPDFDEKQFIAVLEKIYPDQDKVRFVKENFNIKARAIDGNYDVVLCDRDTQKKILEDLSCHVNKVEIRYWDKEMQPLCGFEKNWEAYCK